MKLNSLRGQHSDIIDCEIKDKDGLNDFQKLTNEFGIAIPKVGIERFRIPLMVSKKDSEMVSVESEASMSVFLSARKNGVNMSRFCDILQDQANQNTINVNFFKKILTMFRSDLRDYETEDLIQKSYLKLKFNYPLKQASLKSKRWGWQYYNCTLEGTETADETHLKITIGYEYSSTCPCSLSMAKQYEEEFKKGIVTEGNGIATAHSQRSLATVTVSINLESDFWIEDLIKHLRVALPTETQSLVKRVDEQAFAILNGENPMFVEHATRRISTVLNTDERIVDWEAKVEHFESLHSHNAVASIRKF